MGQAIDAISHSCGTRKGLRIFADEDGSVSGFCFSCSTFILNPYGTPKTVSDLPKPALKTPEEIKEELDEISSYPTVDIFSRKLRKESLEKFGVKVALSEQDGKTPQAMYFPLTRKGELVGYKVKTLGFTENRTWTVGDAKNVDLFNWENARKSGAYRLIICEGEADAVAVDRIYDLHGKDEYKPAIVSLPYGAGQAVKIIQKHLADIKRLFKEVVLCFDNDVPGQDAAKKVMLILPEAKNAILPVKDANDCLKEGLAKAAYKAMQWDSTPVKKSSLVFGEDVHEAAKVAATYGELSWPFPTLNKTLKGIRYGETIYVGAGVKCGKSELLNELAAHFIENHDVKVMMAKPEEDNKKTYKLLAGKIAGKRFHDPDVPFDVEAYEKAGEVLKGKLAMVDIYQNLDWTTLRDDIIAAVDWGAKVVFIDPITVITNGVDAASANTMLQDMAQNLSAMAKDFNIVIFIFCHLKAHDGNISKEQRVKKYHEGKFWDLGNCPHEMGGSIFSAQFAGSRAMMRSADLMLGLEANKDEDLSEEIRNTRRIKLLEDRQWGSTGSVQIYWNHQTTKFVEV